MSELGYGVMVMSCLIGAGLVAMVLILVRVVGAMAAREQRYLETTAAPGNAGPVDGAAPVYIGLAADQAWERGFAANLPEPRRTMGHARCQQISRDHDCDKRLGEHVDGLLGRAVRNYQMTRDDNSVFVEEI